MCAYWVCFLLAWLPRLVALDGCKSAVAPTSDVMQLADFLEDGPRQIRLADEVWQKVHDGGLGSAWSADVQQYVQIDMHDVQHIVCSRHPDVVSKEHTLAEKLDLLPQWLHEAACKASCKGTLELNARTLGQSQLCAFFARVAAVLRVPAVPAAAAAASKAIGHITIDTQGWSSVTSSAVLALLQAAAAADVSVTLDSPLKLQAWQTQILSQAVQTVTGLNIHDYVMEQYDFSFDGALQGLPVMRRLRSLRCYVNNWWDNSCVTALTSVPAECDIEVQLLLPSVRDNVVIALMALTQMRSLSVVAPDNRMISECVAALPHLSRLTQLGLCVDAPTPLHEEVCVGLRAVRQSLCSLTIVGASWVASLTIVRCLSSLTGEQSNTMCIGCRHTLSLCCPLLLCCPHILANLDLRMDV